MTHKPGWILAGMASLLTACSLPWLLQKPQASTQQPPAAITAPAVLPDLTVSAYSWGVSYEGCPWGGPGSVSARVRNEGVAASGEVEVELNGVLTTVPSIPPGGDVDAVVRFEAGPVGGVSLKIDPKNRIPESDEENNEFAIWFTPPPPCE